MSSFKHVSVSTPALVAFVVVFVGHLLLPSPIQLLPSIIAFGVLQPPMVLWVISRARGQWRNKVQLWSVVGKSYRNKLQLK